MGKDSSHHNGFTLAEMAVVIVIIGLMAGLVTAGQELIYSARLRSIIKETYLYQTALNAFYAKYKALPGDMDNAELFWPGQTSNGNGNGSVE